MAANRAPIYRPREEGADEDSAREHARRRLRHLRRPPAPHPPRPIAPRSPPPLSRRRSAPRHQPGWVTGLHQRHGYRDVHFISRRLCDSFKLVCVESPASTQLANYAEVRPSSERNQP
jgi:hypothetical protein